MDLRVRGRQQGRRQCPRAAVRARPRHDPGRRRSSLRRIRRAGCAQPRPAPARPSRGTNAAIYRGELAIRAGLADRVGTLDLALADPIELDEATPCAAIIDPKRRARPAEPTESPHDHDRTTVPARRPSADGAARPCRRRNRGAVACARLSDPRHGRTAARGICRDRSARRSGHPARRQRRCRGRHATGRLRGRSCAAPCSTRSPRAPRPPASSRRRRPRLSPATARSCGVPRNAPPPARA